MHICENCRQKTIPPKHYRYCERCSPLASKIWKHAHRRAWTAQWRAKGGVGLPPWRDAWVSVAAYRAYHRDYMRRRRAMLPFTNQQRRNNDLSVNASVNR
jgi:hypothetical protein